VLKSPTDTIQTHKLLLSVTKYTLVVITLIKTLSHYVMSVYTSLGTI